MDIDLLAKMVGELILDNDEVALPGVGTFVAEMVPASFSDKGYTINPPYRKLSFRQKDDSDTKLIDLYARTNSLDFQDAAKILTPFLQEMKEVLKTKKLIVFPGLGRLRATRENNFFFIPDEDLNIYPAGFGLESISLKTHSEDRAEVAAAVASLEPLLRRPASPASAEPSPAVPESSASSAEPSPAVPESSASSAEPSPAVPEPPASSAEPSPAVPESPASSAEPSPAAGAPAEQPGSASDAMEPASGACEAASEAPAAESASAEPAIEPAPEVAQPVDIAEPASTEPATKPSTGKSQPAPSVKHPVPKWVWIIPCIILCLALLLGIYILLAHIAPDFIDRLLYTPEELQILNYPLE